MFRDTDDLRIEQIRPLIPPAILMENLPLSEKASTTVAESREAVARVLRQQDDRLVVVVGPCSIHDVEAAREYARGRSRPGGGLVSKKRFALMANHWLSTHQILGK